MSETSKAARSSKNGSRHVPIRVLQVRCSIRFMERIDGASPFGASLPQAWLHESLGMVGASRTRLALVSVNSWA